MLSGADNALITQTGPGTALGRLMREYWVPAMASSELPAAGGDPVRVLLLGERFIAFRDSEGRIGMLPAQCPHRGASLFFGRNEQGGIRCAYHGWKFDVSGRCVDMPNEPSESDFKHKVRAGAVRVVERGGLVWAYLGTREHPPELPSLPFLDEAFEGTRQVFLFQMECNWLQTLEGDMDTSHFGFLHTGHLEESDAPEGTFLRHMLEERAPRYQVVDTPIGSTYGAYRPAGSPEETYWRIAHFMFPFYTATPVGLLGDTVGFFARVPMDDTHTMVFFATAGIDLTERGPGIGNNPFDGLRTMPNTTDWYGRFRSARTLENDFEIDREAQRSGRSFSGLDGVPMEDRAVGESMGAVVDRTREHLGSADVMVIRVRRRLLRAVRAFVDEGTPPPGLDEPAAYRQRAGGVVLATGADWLAETSGLRDGTARQHGVDVGISAGV